MEAAVEQLGPYRIIEEIGRGGMGVVYRAQEDELNRTVALKVLSPELLSHEGVLDRFRREAQSAAQLNHPNIVQIHRFESASEPAYFAMEFVEGRNLQELVSERGRLRVPEAAGLILQAAQGLARAHDLGIVHRDIKPANLMVDGDGLLKIADFGVAYVHDATHRLTQSGALIGTPHYLPPEQCLGDPIDGRADIYSLGVSFFQLVTGRVPFDAETPLALLRVICEVELPDPRLFAPSIGEPCCEVLRRMLAKAPEQRYPDCHALIPDLEALANSTGLTASHRQGQQAQPDSEEGAVQSSGQTMPQVHAPAHASPHPATPNTAMPADHVQTPAPTANTQTNPAVPQGEGQTGPEIVHAAPQAQAQGRNNGVWFALAGGMGLLGLGLLALALRPSAPAPTSPTQASSAQAAAAIAEPTKTGVTELPVQAATPTKALPAAAPNEAPSKQAEPNPDKAAVADAAPSPDAKPEVAQPEVAKPKATQRSATTKTPAKRASKAATTAAAVPKRVDPKPQAQPDDPRRTAVIADLRSPLPKIRRRGAKLALRYYHSDAGVLAVAERELRTGYHKVISGKHSDSMAWICKLLGASGDARYKALLLEVAAKAPGKRLRGHAAKAAHYL